MKITTDTTLKNFQTWEGATDTKEKIIEAGKESAFEDMIEEVYPNGLTDTELNDFLWFEEDFIYKTLGITNESEETEE